MPEWSSEQARAALEAELTAYARSFDLIDVRTEAVEQLIVEFAVPGQSGCRFGFRYPVNDDDAIDLSDHVAVARVNLEEWVEADDLQLPECTPGEIAWLPSYRAADPANVGAGPRPGLPHVDDRYDAGVTHIVEGIRDEVHSPRRNDPGGVRSVDRRTSRPGGTRRCRRNRSAARLRVAASAFACQRHSRLASIKRSGASGSRPIARAWMHLVPHARARFHRAGSRRRSLRRRRTRPQAAVRTGTVVVRRVRDEWDRRPSLPAKPSGSRPTRSAHAPDSERKLSGGCAGPAPACASSSLRLGLRLLRRDELRLAGLAGLDVEDRLVGGVAREVALVGDDQLRAEEAHARGARRTAASRSAWRSVPSGAITTIWFETQVGDVDRARRGDGEAVRAVERRGSPRSVAPRRRLPPAPIGTRRMPARRGLPAKLPDSLCWPTRNERAVGGQHDPGRAEHARRRAAGPSATPPACRRPAGMRQITPPS